ncbi:MAG: SusF/SusE family outer membrane protein [Bacteroidota bacterium]
MKKYVLIIVICCLSGSYATVASGQDNPYIAPLYWSVYEYCYSVDGAIPESEWLANIDWVDQNLKSFGYRMICIDGWGDDNQYNQFGYRKKHAEEWTHDYAWWSAELQNRGMTLGIYYNPLWINKSAAASGAIIEGTDIPLSSLIDETEDALWFTWVQVDRPGAEAYVKGYVQFYADMGVKFLRVDFLSWFESGVDKGTRVGPDRPHEHYETALRWMREACDANGMFLSLVMPNLNNEAVTEAEYGHMIRINEDVAYGTWERFNNMDRGIRYPGWSQYHNAFDGYTYWSHISGRNKMILDGDFIRINTMANDEEKKTVISLHLMAGGPLSVADQYSTIGNDLWVYQNTELLALNQDGFVGKPLSNDPADKSSQLWKGQMSNGDWIVGLFNREDKIENRHLEFTALGIEGPAKVRDLWAHNDLGALSALAADIPPHACLIYRVVQGDDPLKIQTIAFDAIPDVENTLNTPQLTLTASSSSGLPVSYEVVYGPAKVKGDTLLFTGGSGEILVTAIQRGNAEFGAAFPVPVVFHATDPIQPFENLYLLGSATPVGWNIGSPIKMTQDETNPYVWQWEGELMAGEFKMPTFTGDWCDGVWINASQPDQILSATDYITTSGCDGPDYKWLVSEKEAGDYRITVDVENETIHVLSIDTPDYEELFVVGDATPAGWTITSPFPMVRDETNPFVFTWEGFLTPGELKFSTFTGDWCDGEWINASQPDQSISATDYIITNGCDGPDYKWRIGSGEVGKYIISIDLKNKSISFQPAVPSNGFSHEEQPQEYAVFPNPVSDQLNIHFGRETVALITLYSATGKVIYQEEKKGMQTSIDLGGFKTSGMLLLKISEDNRSGIFKVFVR